MALTESTMMELGHAAPDFHLPSTTGAHVSLDDVKGASALVIMFICNHCPYVIHIAPALAELAKEYQAKGVAFIAINSNDVDAYPADNFSAMKDEVSLRGYSFPYLLDESQEVAKAYGAACTPDLYVFDNQHTLAYRGQFDDSRPHRISSGNYDSDRTPANGASLKEALNALLDGNKVADKQYPSMGCNIKWKPGNTPVYVS